MEFGYRVLRRSLKKVGEMVNSQCINGGKEVALLLDSRNWVGGNGNPEPTCLGEKEEF